MPADPISAGTPSRRTKVANLLIPGLLSLLLAFGTLEFGLRKFYQLIPLDVCASEAVIGAYVCQPYFVYDKPIRIGYRYEPGFHLEGLWDPADPNLAAAADETEPTGRSDAFYYVFETDEMGFPNSEYRWREQYDMVIAGDSFTIRTAPESWIEILARQSGQEVLTLGAPSWSTLNEVEAVKLYGLDKRPKWVLLMYFEGNDLVNTAHYLERRDSGLNWKEYDLAGVPLTRRLVTPHLLAYAIDQLMPAAVDPSAYRYPVTASTEAGEIDTVLKDIHLLPMSADYRTLAASDEFAAVKQALLDLDQLVKQQGGRFLLVFIPSKEHVLWSRIWDPVAVDHILERTVTVSLSQGEHGQLEWNQQYLSYDRFNENHNAQERLMEDFARENSVEFLNLTPDFWRQSIARGELYHYADPHWNQAGNNLAAQLILEYLQDQ